MDWKILHPIHKIIGNYETKVMLKIAKGNYDLFWLCSIQLVVTLFFVKYLKSEPFDDINWKQVESK